MAGFGGAGVEEDLIFVGIEGGLVGMGFGAGEGGVGEREEEEEKERLGKVGEMHGVCFGRGLCG